MTDTTTVTFTGRVIDVFDPQPEDINIQDIAHGLSNICRFAGQSGFFYSVAQHSGYVSRILDDKSVDVQLWGLMHDAAEAYIGDIPLPIKLAIPEFKVIEDKLLRVIADKFGMQWFGDSGVPDYVDKIDKKMAYTEARQLLPAAEWAKYKGNKYPLTAGFPDMMIQPMTPDQAEQAFLMTFSRLYYDRSRK